ncbi:peroxidase [Favolaschia claudopus]|uniref:Peroxidase n=1 Tax=Favolaschia claudopus TaxID=2862362 RepID=A0AAW0CI26_9AGAR
MKSSTLSTLTLIYALTVAATPTPPFVNSTLATTSHSPRARCGNGRSASNKQCCVWYDVLDDIQANLFDGEECGEDAHDALRLSFHDAIGYSPLLKSRRLPGGGGADGSIIKYASTELSYHPNAGLEDIVNDEKDLADKYGVSYGDIIQFAAAVSVRNCKGGPRIPFMAGRPDPTEPSPENLVPEPFDSVDQILARVKDAGLTPQELVDLLASHSIGLQEHVDSTVAGMPLDTTPTVFDNNFYREMLLPGFYWIGTESVKGAVKSPFRTEFRLQSDWALARDMRTIWEWITLASSQSLMANRFATSMAKMALIGQNPRVLTDCSEVIPLPRSRNN